MDSTDEQQRPDFVHDQELYDVRVQSESERVKRNDADCINDGFRSSFYKKCLHCLDSISRAKNPLPEKPTIGQKIRYTFLCPPHGIVATYLTTIIVFGLLFCFLWSVFGVEAEPPNTFFEIWIHFMSSIIGGYIVYLCGLPPLLGMLIMGMLTQAILNPNINNSLSATLRNIALTVILIRAGLGLNPVALKKLSFVVVRLAFTPCLFEAMTMAISSHLLLDFPIIWGLLQGFTIAAVSPAVVLPCLLHFQDCGYGVDKGIPTLLIAAASIDDVLAITGFGVMIGVAFSEGSIALAFFKGPLEALLGAFLGVVFGVILWYFPAMQQENRFFLKGFILLAVGLMGILGCPRLDLPGAGPLLCLTTAFVAAAGWRQQNEYKCLERISDSMSILWLIFQPLLFGLIGAQMEIDKISADTIYYGVASLIISLSVRTCVAFCCVLGTNFFFKERLFVAMAWLPKATVQAAIGSVALSMAQEKKKTLFKQYGDVILDVAVLSILISAPLGAALIIFMGPRLLTKADPETLPTETPESATGKRKVYGEQKHLSAII